MEPVLAQGAHRPVLLCGVDDLVGGGPLQDPLADEVGDRQELIDGGAAFKACPLALGAPAASAIPTLVEGLDSDGLEVQREIATALGMIGTMTEAVRTALERAAASNDENLRRRAAAALRSLAGR